MSACWLIGNLAVAQTPPVLNPPQGVPPATKSTEPSPRSPAQSRYSILERTEPNQTIGARPPLESSSLTLPPADAGTGTDAGQKLDRLITRLVLENLPHSYEKKKNWGNQDKRWDGVQIRRDGLKVKTKRKWKPVNHGTWKKYSAELIDPDQKFTVQVKNFHRTSSGATGFDIHFTAHLKLHGRQTKWVKGVQLYSLSADGHALVSLVVACELKVSMDASNFPPDLIVDPRAVDAKLRVDQFRLDRISKVGGEFSQQVARQVRKELDDKIREKEKRLVEKINKQLDEKRDRLRLSLADALDLEWTSQAKYFLPAPVQQALDASPKDPETKVGRSDHPVR